MAVGWYDNAAGDEVPLAESWNGKRWKIAKPKDPPGGGAFAGVSCASADSCTAAGTSVKDTQFITFVEHWNGSKWATQKTPNPVAPGGGSELVGVSCAGAHRCIAVGYSYPTAETQTPLAERWDGKKWSIDSPSMPSGATTAQMTGVSCASPSSCIGVGWSTEALTTSTLAEHWNGRSWKVQHTKNAKGSSDSMLTAAFCVSLRSCAAVGEVRTPSDKGLTLAEGWNGSSWKRQKTPNPAGYEFADLEGVACASASRCAAVGSKVTSDISGKTRLLAEQWNGKAWKLQSMASP